MTNTMYDKGRQKFLEGKIAWLTDTIKVVLVDTGAYTFGAGHEFLSDVPSGARIATSAALAGKTTTSGVADANDSVWSAVSGVQSEAVVVYQDTGTPGTSALIAFIDSATGLPVTPNGGDITVTWDNGANKIFKL